jgi:hypothetical protein
VGDPVRINVEAVSETIEVRRPDGTLWSHGADDSTLLFSETNQIGVYEIRSRQANGERPVGLFTVNMSNGEESSIAPVTSVTIGLQSVEAPTVDNVGQREFWPWLASLALLVLLVEWWIYHRGTRLPNRDDWQALTGRRSI